MALEFIKGLFKDGEALTYEERREMSLHEGERKESKMAVIILPHRKRN